MCSLYLYAFVCVNSSFTYTGIVDLFTRDGGCVCVTQAPIVLLRQRVERRKEAEVIVAIRIQNLVRAQVAKSK